MQVNFGSDEPIERIAAGEINHLFQPDGLAFFTRRIAVIGKRGHVDHIVLFGDTEAALTLPGEKSAEARLGAYAAQARESDPLLSPPREPLLSPVRRKTANCCECNGEYPAIDLHEGGEDRCPRCREQARSCLPETQGGVDLAAEANPPMELPF